MADHSKPTTTSTYVNFVSELDGRLDDISLGFDPATTSPTNLATNSIRWTSASNKWQKYNGTTWADLSSAYSININGTVGATTPASGAFTTLSATGNVTLGDASGDTVTINGTVGAGVVISGSTATDALRITQTGAGNALVVEDSTNPDSSPFVVDGFGRTVIGYTSTLSVGDFINTSRAPYLQIQGLGGSPSAAYLGSWSNNDAQPSQLIFGKSKSGTVGTNGIVASGTDIGAVVFSADDGATLIPAASILGEVDGTPGTNDMPGRLVFSTTADGASSPTERMRIDSSGNVAIGASGTFVSTSLRINKNLTGSTSAYGLLSAGAVQSDVTGTAIGYYSNLSLAASVSTTSVAQFYASAASGGAGSAITNQYGFLAESGLGTTGAATITSAFGFYGNLASGTGRWNLFMGGTANNYMAGNLGIGSSALTNYNLRVANSITGGSTSYGIALEGVAQSDVTTAAVGIRSAISLAASVTTTTAYGLQINPAVGGAGSTISNAYGIVVEATQGTQGAATVTNAYGVISSIASGTGRWNLYIPGTANNYMAGRLGIGSTSLTDTILKNTVNMTGATAVYAQQNNGVIQSDVTTDAQYYSATLSTAASAFTLTNSRGFYYRQSTIGAGSAVSNQSGFYVESDVIGATNNYGFNGNIPAGTNRYNLYMPGTANNVFNGYSFGIGGVMRSTTATATNTATLTAAQIASGFIVGTPTGTASYTLPLATDLDTALSGNAPNGLNFEFVVFTTAAFAITILTNTGWTLLGSMATGATANSFARFRARKTGTGAWSLYRIS